MCVLCVLECRLFVVCVVDESYINWSVIDVLVAVEFQLFHTVLHILLQPVHDTDRRLRFLLKDL